MTITSGFETRKAPVTVPSAAGPLVRSVGRRGRSVRPGRRTTVAVVRLAQPARAIVRVQRAGRTVGTLVEACAVARRPIAVRWDGRLGGTAARPGRYTVVVRIASDRPSIVRRYIVRVIGR